MSSRSTKEEAEKGRKKEKSPLISDYDGSGRPVGKGGRKRQRNIDDYVDRAESGK